LDAANKQNFDTKSITWGAQVGVGVDVLKRITLDINYNFGLSKVFEQLNTTTLGEYFDFGNTDYSRQNTFMVTVGFKFL
jgi:opacity protein-like surface antigen